MSVLIVEHVSEDERGEGAQKDCVCFLLTRALAKIRPQMRRDQAQFLRAVEALHFDPLT
jgi:hypothetical protein